MNQPLAYAHPEAKIASNVVIEPFATIHKNVEIGEGTWIGSNVTIMEGARIGKNCKIFPGAVISAVPQDMKFAGEESLVVIGNNTVIRECVTLNRGTKERGETTIGSNCLLMAYVHIAHDCIINDRVVLSNAVQVGGHVEIGAHAILGGTSAVHQFCKVGAHTMLQGGSLVTKDVPPYVTAGRFPLSYAGVNSIGLRRRGFSNEKINEIQEIYRHIYLKGLNNNQALDIIQLEMNPSKERDEIIHFVSSSSRGIIKGIAH
ncbi:acyl-ACP--UDP-N-acetylglucosamine O-acyltransferase [Xanthovirga aplysinae]|uniref:acyl-ACP--UDP-N-acetylglucosamine O-acyltransferase n=1 Tax=Xanthovirga aplysinae TaxID=2529853 RepID=UPI0012BD1A3E|nr:acyl-ACP--UDP-N-acetylglucosamine O-acyltransferase [Xanthovirga aplysinae]MTI30641.1 acyl-ACP--UDP-N-acetylglucosamine O-acyltransferase [Xanthovirga aplysinae]